MDRSRGTFDFDKETVVTLWTPNHKSTRRPVMVMYVVGSPLGHYPSPQHPVEVPPAVKPTEETNCCEKEKRNNGIMYALLAILIPIGALVLALSSKECPAEFSESTCIVLDDGSFPC